MADKIVKIYGDARFIPRHDTLENWQTKNPVLLQAEPSYVIDGKDGEKIKFGDGVTPWDELPYLSSSINNGGDITVDQTYNPESENAQSGKAVFEAIATEIERVNNTFAPVIKNTLFGEAIVTKDISPLEHTVGLKVSSDTIEDLTTININTAGKNLLSEDIFAPKNWRLVSNGIRYVYKLPTINGDCVFSYALNGTRVPGYHAIYRVPKGMDYEEAYQEGLCKSMGFLTGATNTTVTTTSMVLPNGYDYYYWICYAELIDADLASFEYMQLEVGTDATEYEAYKGQDTYTPIADGTVKGVKSIYPSMTIFTDNDGVLINCEYNADTKKYIDNKFAELQALVLEG